MEWREDIDMKKILPVLIVVILFSGCLVGGRYESQTTHVDTTYVYPHSEHPDTLALVKWFDLYKDEALSHLIKVALDSNRNLLSAMARTEEARERAGIVKSTPVSYTHLRA